MESLLNRNKPYKPCKQQIIIFLKKYDFGHPVYSKKAKICFNSCITLYLPNILFNLLSFALLNNELAVTEILLESKLLWCVAANGISISSFLGPGSFSLALKKIFL